MRKLLNLTILLFLMMLLSCHAFAAEPAEVTTIYTTIDIHSEIYSGESISGGKTYTYHSADDTPLWQAEIWGEFEFTTDGVRCRDAGYDVEVIDDLWYVISAEAHPSGSVALGHVVLGRRFLGVTVDRETVVMVLTTDELEKYR